MLSLPTNTVTLLAFSLFTATVANPARLPTERRQGAQVISSCTQPNTAALTFDDGPYLYTREVADTLANAGARGTFFFNGNNYGCIYEGANVDRIKYAYSRGHQVASHTWAHRDLTKLSRGQISSEMQRVEQALKRIVGVTPAFTRPPFGNVNSLVREVAAERRQRLVTWDFDSRDSLGASAAESKRLYDALISRRPSSILALNHEVLGPTARDVLPYVIGRLRGAGYRLVTVAECLGEAPYLNTGTPGTRDASWTC